MNELSKPPESMEKAPQAAAAHDTKNQTYVADGMPALEYDENPVSFFEFWPTWLIYLPVVLQWLMLAVRYRSLTVPLLANPSLSLSGMVGVPKSKILSQATGLCEQVILDWFVWEKSDAHIESQIQSLKAQAAELSIDYPFVCKPDIGCRGAGVKLVNNDNELTKCLEVYPHNGRVMVQKLSSYEPEAGLFFVREPNQEKGRIISLALKYSPYVVGDGQSNLRELIARDPRASEVSHLYLERHADHLDQVLAEGEAFKLVFSASHCRGAVFRNANENIAPALTTRMNTLMADLPDFYYGRLDIKFKNIAQLEQGENIEIIEINTASSESLHIWDARTRFIDAIKALLYQYRILFRIGAQNRARGFEPPGVLSLLKHWQLERKLTKSYPTTD